MVNLQHPNRPLAPKLRAATWLDWTMLALAVFSVLLLGYVTFFPHSDATAHVIFVIDTCVCGIFFVEFCWRWRKDRWQRSFPLRHWYEILGMIPIAHPALRSFRLIRIVVVLIRLARAADRAFGEAFTYRLVEAMSRPIVLAIKKPITVAVLDEVVKVVETGNYPQNLARSLDENREELRAIVTEKVREDRQAGVFRRLPFHDDVVESIVDTAMRVILEVLLDPRIDAFFAHVVRENRLQIRRAVQLGLSEQPHDDAVDQLPVRPEKAAVSG